MNRRSFCDNQIAASGLSHNDIMANVTKQDGSRERVPVLIEGTIRNNSFDPNGDDMCIVYVDLQGHYSTYSPKGTKAIKQLLRVRWKDPDKHHNQEGKPIKYQTPAGAKAVPFIPQYIRDCFNNHSHLPYLIEIEGEKKALCGCKYGIPCIGTQGIFNTGNMEDGVHDDIKQIMRQCTVQKIVMFMDSDLFNLSSHIEPGENVEKRPTSFAQAVIKFKTFVSSLFNEGLDFDILFGYVLPNEFGAKGLDDLIVALGGDGEAVRRDIDFAMNAFNGQGQYVAIHDISAKSKSSILSLWHLNNIDEFFEAHREELSELGTFRFSRSLYNVENGKCVKTQTFQGKGEFWAVTINTKGDKKFSFKTSQALSFLASNGYFILNNNDREATYVYDDDGILQQVNDRIIRRFVHRYVKENVSDVDTLDFISARIGKELSWDKLELLDGIDDPLAAIEEGAQCYNFMNTGVRVTADAIEEVSLPTYLWENMMIKRKFQRIPIFKSIEFNGGEMRYELTEAGRRCEILRFIEYTSMFPSDSEAERQSMFFRNVFNKITCSGYLLTRFKSEYKAIVMIDGTESDGNTADGRTGKSLLGKAYGYFANLVSIDGRNTKNSDSFVFFNVDRTTDLIFMEDIRHDYNFENLYNCITSDLTVNRKNKEQFVIPKDKSPKFLIATNYMIRDRSRSAEHRMVYMLFSDHYNNHYEPIHDFKHLLFEGWKGDFAEQWTLFDNFMLECAQVYFRSLREGWQAEGTGIVSAPFDLIRIRNSRNSMGANFFSWISDYLSPESGRLNTSLKRDDMMADYRREFSGDITMSSERFRELCIEYCKYAGLHFNPTKLNAKHQTFEEFYHQDPHGTFVGVRDRANNTSYYTFGTVDWCCRGMPF